MLALLALLLLVAEPAHAQEPICRGGLLVADQTGADGLVGNAFVKGTGGNVSGSTLSLEHNAGFSLTTDCREEWEPRGFSLFKLLGRTLSFTVDLHAVGCACNLALYLVEEPARDVDGVPSLAGEDAPDFCKSSPYYCDANQVCGQWCPEIDLMEANNRVFASTPHHCDAPTSAGHYENCDRAGCTGSTKALDVQAYGPGTEFTIDTTKPFHVHTSFHGDPEAQTFKGVFARLEQDGRELVLDHSSCSSSYLQNLARAMSSGMAMRITYWGQDAQTMSWLDMPPCGEETCSGANAGKAIISNIVIHYGPTPLTTPQPPTSTATTPTPPPAVLPTLPPFTPPPTTPVTTQPVVLTMPPTPPPSTTTRELKPLVALGDQDSRHSTTTRQDGTDASGGLSPWWTVLFLFIAAGLACGLFFSKGRGIDTLLENAGIMLRSCQGRRNRGPAGSLQRVYAPGRIQNPARPHGHSENTDSEAGLPRTASEYQARAQRSLAMADGDGGSREGTLDRESTSGQSRGPWATRLRRPLQSELLECPSEPTGPRAGAMLANPSGGETVRQARLESSAQASERSPGEEPQGGPFAGGGTPPGSPTANSPVGEPSMSVFNMVFCTGCRRSSVNSQLLLSGQGL